MKVNSLFELTRFVKRLVLISLVIGAHSLALAQDSNMSEPETTESNAPPFPYVENDSNQPVYQDPMPGSEPIPMPEPISDPVRSPSDTSNPIKFKRVPSGTAKASKQKTPKSPSPNK